VPRLDEIEWHRLHGPYGTSKGVPAALRDLEAESARKRATAVGFLQEHLWHQGTVYEVSAPAVPFVADAALGPSVGRDDRIWLILLLTSIADGSSYLDVHRELDEEEDIPADEAELQRELGWVNDAREAVRQRLPEFIGRLRTEADVSTQVALAQLAAQFPERANESLALVEELAEREPDEPRKLVLELAVAAIGGTADREDLLRRLPDDYYDSEETDEIANRLVEAEDAKCVYREILENVIGAAIEFESSES
jgi:hypothetical protein